MEIAANTTAPARAGRQPLSYNQLVRRRFLRHRLAVVGVVLFSMIALAAFFAPLLTPYDPAEQDLFNIAQPPSPEHPLGTDELGRDLWARVLYGGRVSLTVGISAALISTLIGVTVGAIAGYYGGTIDNLLMRLVDLLLAFPAIFLLLILFSLIRPSLGAVIFSWACSAGFTWRA